jgi:tetratricopeptide (TPR) repeat protein
VARKPGTLLRAGILAALACAAVAAFTPMLARTVVVNSAGVLLARQPFSVEEGTEVRGSPSEAGEALLRLAGGIWPYDSSLSTFRAESALRRADFPAAIHHFRQALSAPGLSERRTRSTRWRLGSVYADSGQEDLALDEWREARAGVLALAKAREELRLGRAESALRWFGFAIQIEPGLEIAYLSRASVYEQLGRRAEASATYADAVHRFPTSTAAYVALGNVHGSAGDYRSARRVLEECLAKAADANSCRYYLAVWLEKAGETASAIEHFRQLSVVTPASREVWAHLGELYARLGDCETAVTMYLQAERLADHPIWLIHGPAHVARVYAGMRRYDQAEEAFQRSIKAARAQGASALAQELEAERQRLRAATSSAPPSGYQCQS